MSALRGKSAREVLLTIDPDTLEPLHAPLERLFRAHDAKVRRSLAGTFPRAGEDRVADAMAHAWCAAARYVHDLRFADADRWLYVVARNEMYAIFDRERRQTAIDNADLVALAGGDEDDLAEHLHAREESKRVLAGLIPNQRRALVARALGLSYRQIAQATGQSHTHVNRHLTEGRARAWNQRFAEAA